MPRSNSIDEVFQYLNTFYKFTEATGTHGSSTTNEAITVDMADVDLVASGGTNFTNGDFLLISGSGGVEISKLATKTTDNLAFDRPVQIAQDAGAIVVEAVRTDLGHVGEEGVTFGGTQTITPINAATSRTPLGYIIATAELTFSVPLLGTNNLNLQTVFGVTEAENGVGTAADPYAVVIDGNTIGTQGLQGYRAVGQLYGGEIIEIDFLGVTTEINVSRNIGGTAVTGYTLNGKATGFAQRIWTPA
jgi:hypothetical protein